MSHKIHKSIINLLTQGSLLFLGLSLSISVFAGDKTHPNLTVTQNDISHIRAEINRVPRAKAALNELVSEVGIVLTQAMDVPIPKDAGGGYTHEQHKRNYKLLYNAALLFQITKEHQYLDFVKNMLLEYSALYPTLSIHPKPKEQTPGKLFWQSLNEAMWLVHTIQAYDMVAGALSDEDRLEIETNLLRPVAHYLSVGQPQTFNKIHNHGTWAAAAVGMTGYVLGDKNLVDQALYGLDKTGEAGFLQQINQLFSPDGYYAEGPYYQRFALMPFVLFAKAIQVNNPELEIFEYRDEVLLKAIRTSIQLSYNKLFFGINDAIKDKGIDTVELVHGIAIAYQFTKDPTLLSVAAEQNHILLTGYGFTVAKDLDQKLSQPFQFKSMQLLDGKDGEQGALSIFRNGIKKGHQALVMKNTSQGLGHGHFDKLHWLYFDNGNEVISDYGAARFLNIEAKYGGHYLPENDSWAKQSIAHNTIVVDEQSQFNGDWRISQKFAPSINFFAAGKNIKISSASIDSAYPEVRLTRTMAMINFEDLEYPLILDVFKADGDSAHQYDLPLHYQGHLISHNMEFRGNTENLLPIGDENGYQYLWDRGRASLTEPLSQLTWLLDGRFYTYTTQGGEGESMIFGQLGANDPNFNLRNENSLIHRVSSSKSHTFVSLLETHGEYNGRAEFTRDAKSKIFSLTSSAGDSADVVTVTLIGGNTFSLAIAYDGDEKTEHKILHNGELIEWIGNYAVLP